MEPRSQQKPVIAHDYLERFPRLCAHIIAESLGDAVPIVAASILKDAKEGRKNYCEWIDSCYNSDPKRAVANAIQRRHTHVGYMTSYDLALRIVRHQVETGESPLLASWF